MPRLILELDVELYRLLQQAAHSNQLSLEEECCAGWKEQQGARSTCMPCWLICAPMMHSVAQIRRAAEGLTGRSQPC